MEEAVGCGGVVVVVVVVVVIFVDESRFFDFLSLV